MLCLASCPASFVPRTPGYDSHLANVTSYGFKQSRVTPGGISVDDPYAQVSDTAIDEATAATEACLAALPELTPAQAVAAKCLVTPLPKVIDRKRIAVQVPPDWYTSSCTGQQLFPCTIDVAYCRVKPELDEITCKCNCRATVQDDRVIVTAPNLRLYRAELLRLVTSCNYVWVKPLEACAGP